MFKPRILLILFLLVLTFAWLSTLGVWKKHLSHSAADHPKLYTLSVSYIEKLETKAMEAKTFASKQGYNTSICFLVDMSIPSGQNRFFVYDMQKDSIKNRGLVTHGRCNENWLEGRKYGNTPGCGCTSLGKYKVGYPYTGRFGLAFKLYGLDKTNDKAFDRFVVLHSHSCVPATEVKNEICQSDGCPTVAPDFLRYLQPVINTSKKPVLLWIYE